MLKIQLRTAAWAMLVSFSANCALAANLREDAPIKMDPDANSETKSELKKGDAALLIQPVDRKASYDGWARVRSQDSAGQSVTGWTEISKLELGPREEELVDKSLRTRARFYAGAGLAETFTLPKGTGAHLVMGGDWFFAKYFMIGGLLDDYAMNVEGSHLNRVDLTFSPGVAVIPEKLFVRAYVGYQSTTMDSFSGGSSTSYGAGITYRTRLSRHWDIAADLMWQHFPAVTLSRDTGVPVSNSDIGNAFCTIFTLGFSNGCGDKFEYLDVPSSDAVVLGISLGFSI